MNVMYESNTLVLVGNNQSERFNEKDDNTSIF